MRVPFSDRYARPSCKLSPFYSTQLWYIHLTYTSCSSWHDLPMPNWLVSLNYITRLSDHG